MRKEKIKIRIKPDVKSYKRISRDVFMNAPTYTNVHRDHSRYYRPEEKRKLRKDYRGMFASSHYTFHSLTDKEILSMKQMSDVIK